MKTFLRMLIYFAIIAWLGAEFFFPVMAQICFAALAPQTHVAGQIVGACLAVVHREGIVCAVLIAIALMGAGRAGIYSRSDILFLLAIVVLMLAATLVSELTITPRMHALRIQSGGAIDALPPDDPNRIAFEKLHKASEHAEEGIALLGLVFVVLLARAEGKPKLPAAAWHAARPQPSAV